MFYSDRFRRGSVFPPDRDKVRNFKTENPSNLGEISQLDPNGTQICVPYTIHVSRLRPFLLQESDKRPLGQRFAHRARVQIQLLDVQAADGIAVNAPLPQAEG